MKIEFNLSDKRMKANVIYSDAKVYFENDVREFIKLLKAEIKDGRFASAEEQIKRIDKLAGTELI